METYLTKISTNNLTFLRDKDLTPKEIISFLNEGALFRKFSDVLVRVYLKEDLYSVLIEGLQELNGGDQQNIARKVRNWLNGSNTPKNREQLFHICFILKLDEPKANILLGTASDTEIHYRNPVELVYAYCLRTGKDYAYALKLKEQIMNSFNIKNDNKEKKQYTYQIREEFKYVQTDEDLFAFFSEFMHDLGVIHETAYEKFIEMLELLQSPNTEAADIPENVYSVERIINEYLRMNIPFERKSSEYTLLQKMIKKNWPNESDLIKMKNRKKDVSRKVMLLLYLITEEFDKEFDENEYFLYVDEDDDPNIQFEIRLKKMNVFLDKYGMNKLDPGNPFDCLVLYAMKTQYNEFLSDKISEAVKFLFKELD